MPRMRHNLPVDAGATGTGSRNTGYIRFDIACAAPRVYLLVRDETGTLVECSEMEPLGGTRWTLTLPLAPGIYRYRYYSEDAGVITYRSPADVDVIPVRVLGWDALVAVPFRPDRHYLPESAAAEVTGSAPDQRRGPRAAAQSPRKRCGRNYRGTGGSHETPDH